MSSPRSPRKDHEGSRKGSRGSTGRPASYESGGAAARQGSSSGDGSKARQGSSSGDGSKARQGSSSGDGSKARQGSSSGYGSKAGSKCPRKGTRTTSKSNPTPHTHQAQSSAHHKTDISPITEATQRKTSKDKVDDHARHKPPSTGGAEGSGQPHPQGHEKKKPTTKAERRALQEAQRKAKADKLAAAGKGPPVSKPSGTGESHSSGGTGEGAKTSGGGGTKTHGQMQGQSEEQRGQGSHQKSQTHQAHHQRGSHLNKVGKSKSQEQPSQRQVQLFSHLPQYERERHHLTASLDYSASSLPPCIVRLGLKYSEGIICGSNARCIALLAAFKIVIQDYSTPAEKELRRDLDATIRPYISFLTRCRPLSVSMGNAIKHLKLKISKIPHDMPEKEAKESLCTAIDDYLRVKIQLADEAISEYCGTVINNGDVILVYAHSSIVQKALIDAHKSDKNFRVIVVDSRPKMEGRVCLRHLVKAGIKCSYVLINAVSYIMKEVSKVIVGAHGLLANGYVMSRVGTSLIALVAKSYNVPVLVCCETYKFCDKVQTDAFVINELGDPNDLVPIQRRQGNFLSDWKSINTLTLLNLVYDVTSPDLITMVITQIGNIPCTSVPVVLRISRDIEQM